MTNKQNELRKKRIKDIIFKALHIICYVLSILFIGVFVIAGFKSCEKKPQSVSAEENSGLYIYENKYNDSSTFSPMTLCEAYDVPTSLQSSSGTIYRYVYYEGAQFNNGSSLYHLTNITLKFSTIGASSYVPSNLYYQLESIIFGSEEGSTLYFCIRTNNYYNPNLILDFQNITLLFNEYPSDQYFLTSFFNLSRSSNFLFNKQFNYNAPLNTTIDGVYGTGTMTQTHQYGAYKDYNIGYFMSNGLVFNSIRVHFQNSDSTSALIEGEPQLAPSGFLIYVMMEYRNTNNNYSVTVNIHDQAPYKYNGGDSKYYLNSSTWFNDSFRYITLFDSLNNADRLSLNSFNNNNQNYFSGQIYSDGYDVFTLLSLGFSSLSDFWQLQILPGISIGVLFFLPAVVGIIITIVHLLRK